MALTEDDLYRKSTQYRLWSYTAEQLSSMRSQTNALAAERVKLAIKSVRQARSVTKDSTDPDEEKNDSTGRETENGTAIHTTNPPKVSTTDDIECLTVVEERKLVEYYCGQCVELGKFFEFPINVVATAVQFMKRFYLSNSPMTYHPKQIMPSALFLATKTENNHIYLKDYVNRLSNPKKQVTPDDILAPEFIITQGLRFTFDVRHPHRGLKGGYMELLALASGKAALLPWLAAKTSPARLRDEMRALPSSSVSQVLEKKSPATAAVPLDRRLEIAYSRANEVLKSSAILSDAYFLYSPAQIWLAALLLVDEPLTLFYLDTKIPPTPESEEKESQPSIVSFKKKIILTLRSCAELLRASGSISGLNGSSAGAATDSKQNREELIRIDKKLYQCRNPEKMDLIGINKAQKRDGVEADGKLDGGVAKKRKLERERLEQDGGDLFGPTLGGGTDK